MTERMHHNRPMSIGEQAEQWLLRWHCGELTVAERFEYVQWLKASPVHVAETLHMCKVHSWVESRKLRLFITNEDSFSNVVQLPPAEVQRIDPFEAELARVARSYPVDTDTLVRNAREALAERRLWRWAQWTREFMSPRVVAAAAAATVATVTLAVWLIRAIVPVQGMETTQAGEWRTVTFEDGTEVMLGPRTRARPEYDESHRGILVESGKALFKVAQDPRPFLARTERLTARAVSTEFGISLDGSDDGVVTVTVKEGGVAVSLHDRPAEESYVAAGEQLRVENDWPVVPLRIDLAREFAWTHKRLKFEDGDTLASAVKEFNRFNAIQIEVDRTLAGRPVRGEFDADDPLSFAQSASRQADVVVTRRADTVRLEVKEQPSGEVDPGVRNDG